MSYSSKQVKIDDKTVPQKEFERFLASLTEIEHTWFCAETSDGGSTGYNAKNADGIVYEYRAETIGKKNSNTISKQMLWTPHH